MRRILLDQGLSPLTAGLLNAEGWDAVHVMEVGLDRAADLAILQYAARDGRVCVTLDHDFHAHLARAQSSGPSVVFVRLEGQDAAHQAGIIRRVWTTCEAALAEGAAVTVDVTSIRVRKLPLS